MTNLQIASDAESRAAIPARRRRLLINLVVVAVLLGTLAMSAGAALGQSSALNNLGCWGHFTGGGGQRSTALNRINDEITWVGGGMSTPNNRLRANPFSLMYMWRPIRGTPQPPILNTSTTFLPLASNAWNFSLTRLCS
jgi:hypothetical protein